MLHQTRRTLALTPKFLGLAGAAVTLALIAVFMSVPFLVRRDLTPASAYQIGAFTASPEVRVFPNGTYLLTLAFTDGAGKQIDVEPLSVTVQMAGMEPNPQELSRLATGLYRGTGLFSMPGRWIFTVRTAVGSVEIPAGTSGSF
ncbi:MULTISPECIES: hypothetical protein [unclassified Devosia]|uniref:hypothetical protein n=1 Tax=unclassified Devosia TaxID=196773 RepID=UPI0008691C5A|nr:MULTISPECIES: hypothetical protein [unclassified Devosia]MBN9360743.1 FixH family protein [Devosia sp.]ODS87932.1 MAG: hypothetical protein ABS47_11150 [Devosia sp. SCN 66-27]OJX22707.1 MAG: hypothetical protein BGO83_18130 [Devosia sp. 66-14]